MAHRRRAGHAVRRNDRGARLARALRRRGDVLAGAYVEIKTKDGTFAGEAIAKEGEGFFRQWNVDAAAHAPGGNFELSGEHFRWMSDPAITAETRPEWGVVVEDRLGALLRPPKGFELDRQARRADAGGRVEAPGAPRRGAQALRGASRPGDQGHRRPERAAGGRAPRAPPGAGGGGSRDAAVPGGEGNFNARVAPLETKSTEIRTKIDALNAQNDGIRLGTSRPPTARTFRSSWRTSSGLCAEPDPPRGRS